MNDGYTVYGKIPNDVWNDQKPVIVKIQIPLGGELTHALVYDKTKKWQFYIPMSEIKASGLNMGNKVKKYFWIWFDENKAIVFDKEVKEQQTW